MSLVSPLSPLRVWPATVSLNQPIQIYSTFGAEESTDETRYLVYLGTCVGT